MTLEIGEIIVYGLVMGLFGGAVGWAASVGRTEATKKLPAKKPSFVAYLQVSEPEQLTEDEATELFGVVNSMKKPEDVEEVFTTAVQIHRAERETRRIKK